ncbi:hypothetical protein SODALDRAFT_328362 [Sodiomyces alkalinus F11]|uniref:Uncharacterized protein n=1 Tax=Sodiomyces alkalinus (strain CBS 110278 / VKM F-3762 / F11) TaxID=1314773 RepID=A0A3N2PNH7_SODAK|nr:hypothetical protein SODALDRAFT_328362 [Sodiomyces alkalinus F11]ROT35984.1 hypothetical protein SODALDRAFT_328362 [Sodiomyces alkalinus F11]
MPELFESPLIASLSLSLSLSLYLYLYLSLSLSAYLSIGISQCLHSIHLQTTPVIYRKRKPDLATISLRLPFHCP